MVLRYNPLVTKGFERDQPGPPGQSGVSGYFVIGGGSALTLPAAGYGASGAGVTVPSLSTGTLSNGQQLFVTVPNSGLCVLENTAGTLKLTRWLPAAATSSVPVGSVLTAESNSGGTFPITANFTVPTSGSVSVSLGIPSNYLPPSGQKLYLTIAGYSGEVVYSGSGSAWTFTPTTYPPSTVDVVAATNYFIATAVVNLFANSAISNNPFDYNLINFKDSANNLLGCFVKDGTFEVTKALISNLSAILKYGNATQSDDKVTSSFFNITNNLGQPLLRTNPKTGEIKIEKPVLVDAKAGLLSVGRLSATAGLSAYQTATDSLGNIFWTANDGNGLRQIYGQNYTTGIATQLTTLGENYSPSCSSSQPGIVFFVTNRNGYDESYWADFNGTVGASVASEQLRLAGDSMPGIMRSAAAGIPGNLFTARGFYDAAVGGQTSTENASLMGAIPVTCTVAGGSINASGTTQVTLSIDISRNQVQFSPACVIQGFFGTLLRNPLGGGTLVDYTFTRSIPGSSVAASGSVPVKILAQQNVPMSTIYNGTWIIWTGHNDVIQVSLEQYRDLILANVAGIVSKIPKNRKFLVLSLTSAGNGINPAGYRPKIQAVNAALAALYGYNYFDQHAWCLQQCVDGYNAGDARFTFPASSAGSNGAQSSAQTQIFTDQIMPLNGGTDTTNFGWRGDSVHYNGYGFTALWNKIQSILIERNW